MSIAKTVELGEVCKVVMGQSPPSSSYNTAKDGLPFFQGKTDFGDLYPTARFFCSEPTRVAYGGDVLISVRAPVGPTNLAREQCCIGRGLSALQAQENLDPIYLLFFLRYFEPQLVRLGKGSTFEAVNRDDLESLRIPLPSISEQQRIAAQLEQADRLRRTRRYALELSDSFLPAAFLELFGDLSANEKCWPIAVFDDVCAIDAPLVDPKLPQYRGLPHIGGDNIESVTGRILEVRTAAADGLVSAKFLINPEHVLFSKIRPKLRKVAEPNMVALCSADIYPIRPRTKEIHPRYLSSFLRSAYFTRIVSSLADTRTNIPKVNREELSDIAVLLPPMEQQSAFAALVERHEHLRATQREALRQAEHLFQTLLHRAFSAGV